MFAALFHILGHLADRLVAAMVMAFAAAHVASGPVVTLGVSALLVAPTLLFLVSLFAAFVRGLEGCGHSRA